MFVKAIRNVLPSAPDLAESNPSWKVETEPDGSKTVVTLGQRIAGEIITAFQKESTVSKPAERTLDADFAANQTTPTKIVGFDSQPSDRFYAISARLDFHGSSPSDLDRSQMVRGGFRVLASSQEWTDIYYEPSTESLVVSRLHSSLISSCQFNGVT